MGVFDHAITVGDLLIALGILAALGVGFVVFACFAVNFGWVKG